MRYAEFRLDAGCGAGIREGGKGDDGCGGCLIAVPAFRIALFRIPHSGPASRIGSKFRIPNQDFVRYSLTCGSTLNRMSTKSRGSPRLASTSTLLITRSTRWSGEQRELEASHWHSFAPQRHASRFPCFISCSTTQGTSIDVIVRSGRYDQKHNAWNRRYARRASRTLTIRRAVAGSSTRRLLRPPRLPMVARYRLISDMPKRKRLMI